MTKSDIRQNYLKLRENLSINEVETISENINNHIISGLSLSIKSIHTFVAIANSKEINTWGFIQYCWQNNISTATSITCLNPKRLEHTQINDQTTFKAGVFNVPEPAPIVSVDLNTLDLVVVPLLCVDFLGNRIGYGQGFYDGFLSQLPSKTIKLGVSLFEIHDKIIPADPWDVKLDGVVSQQGVTQFKQ
ncbi:MAG: 5-formyltetrahydrofolate cyclo-ligase [Flavobacteriales bacterium]|nr:5-formyltetrahydrofolate cyclo-ligase [Flavobacteriales bacterium]